MPITKRALQPAGTTPGVWAAMLFCVLAASAGCSSNNVACATDQLPPSDPCFRKPCCSIVVLDSGVGDAGNLDQTLRQCGGQCDE